MDLPPEISATSHVAPARVVEDVGQHRPDDLRVGARRDPLQPLGGRVVEAELLAGSYGALRHALDPVGPIGPTPRRGARGQAPAELPLVVGGVSELLLAHDDPS